MSPSLREILDDERETTLLWSGHLRGLNPEAPAIWRKRQWAKLALEILGAGILLLSPFLLALLSHLVK